MFVFVYNDKIFVIGGECGEDIILIDCEVYDLVIDDW